jgi:Domain of unknown function DUF11
VAQEPYRGAPIPHQRRHRHRSTPRLPRPRDVRSKKHASQVPWGTFTATSFLCQIDNLGVGETRVVRITVKVTGCNNQYLADAYSAAALNDPNHSNDDFFVRIKVQGCYRS